MQNGSEYPLPLPHAGQGRNAKEESSVPLRFLVNSASPNSDMGNTRKGAPSFFRARSSSSVSAARCSGCCMSIKSTTNSPPMLRSFTCLAISRAAARLVW